MSTDFWRVRLSFLCIKKIYRILFMWIDGSRKLHKHSIITPIFTIHKRNNTGTFITSDVLVNIWHWCKRTKRTKLLWRRKQTNGGKTQRLWLNRTLREGHDVLWRLKPVKSQGKKFWTGWTRPIRDPDEISLVRLRRGSRLLRWGNGEWTWLNKKTIQCLENQMRDKNHLF